MNYIPPAAAMRLRLLAEQNDAIQRLYNELESALLDLMIDNVELDTIDLSSEDKIDIITILEDLGYTVDANYGEELIRVSIR